MTKTLIIGMAPNASRVGPNGGTLHALQSESGRRIAEWCKISNIQDVFDTSNLFRRPVETWSKPMARVAAEQWTTAIKGRRVILLGVEVAGAFGLKGTRPFVWYRWRGMDVAWSPHTSGRNRYWNDEENLKRGIRFFRTAAGIRNERES